MDTFSIIVFVVVAVIVVVIIIIIIIIITTTSITQLGKEKFPTLVITSVMSARYVG